MLMNLTLFRNELKNKHVDRYKMIGIVTEQKKLLYKLIDKRIQELQKNMKKQKNMLDNYYI